VESLGYVSAVDSQGRTIWIADAHHGAGKRFIVRADEKLSAFVELEPQVLTVWKEWNTSMLEVTQPSS